MAARTPKLSVEELESLERHLRALGFSDMDLVWMNDEPDAINRYIDEHGMIRHGSKEGT